MTSEVLSALKTPASPQQVISAMPVTVGTNHKAKDSNVMAALVRIGHGVNSHDLKSRLVMRFNKHYMGKRGES